MLWKKESDKNDAWYIDIRDHIRDHIRKLHRNNPGFVVISPFDNLSRQQRGGDGKNNEKSIEYRQLGDMELKKQNWYEAIELYNQSLCYAANGSEHIGLGYAKRAQCFSSLKMFDKCIVDIELAEKSNYPVDELHELKERKVISLKLIAAGAQVKLVEPKLDHEPHKDFPEMASSLEFRRNEQFGKHLVATGDIDVGDVIIHEKSFAIIPTECYKYCNICMVAQTNLIPCTKCTTALLCSKCKDDKMHPFECYMHGRFKELDFWKNAVLGIRTLFIAINLFSNADELMRFVEEAVTDDELPTSINEPQSKYRWFLRTLKTYMPNTVEFDKLILQTTLPFHMLYESLIEYQEFNEFFKNENQRRFFMHLVYYHLALSYIARNQVDFPVIIQFINHSCIPCVGTFLIDGYVIAVAFRPIRKGEQIFKCYFGCCTTEMTFTQRQNYLRDVYQFDCTCERCDEKDVAPVALVKSMRSDHNLRLVRQNFECSNESDHKQRKALTKAVKAILRKHYRVVWADGFEDVLYVFRNLLLFKFNCKTEY